MPDIIRLLPDSLANQIAAGEVVQRPASAIKELLENAIDADALDIRVIIKEAGKTLMQVIDDGKGMSATDARMSLERHATSKITTSEDLFKIRTMGFRGEALASIAAVSQLEIKTKQREAELGTLIYVEGSEVKKQEPTATDEGTSICVKNLFYNVPARRNFLKSNGVEMKHIVDEFQRVALANPQVAMSLYQNDLETYNLHSGKLSQRIVSLFGKNYREQLAACQEETDQIKVHGYIGKPDFAKKTRGEQFFFVNNRFIKSNYLNHAVMNAFEGLLPEGSFPFYVLFMEMDPKHVDINVHPTKTEIKFDNERVVYAVVRAAVRQALATHNITPALDFDADINLSQKLNIPRETVKDKNYAQFKTTTSPREQSNFDNWEKLFSEHEGRDIRPREVSREPEEEPMTLTFGSEMNAPASPAEQPVEKSTIFQLHNGYIITQVKSGMMIVDQQAAHERVLFENFFQNLEHRSGASQQTLFPQTVSLNPSDYSVVMDMDDEMRALGFMIEPFGKTDVLVKGIPADLPSGNEKEIFEGLIEQYKKNKSELSIPRRENLARALAKRSAMKHGKRLSEEEMSGLIDQLFACSNPNYAPNGQRTFYIMELSQIENYFK
ncbi:DNA mismatch repair endonuclease MutL [Fulvivirga sp. RKSG066]|uniref:DNA mismatch repair endonuclease MutL n=1 Tax=Fulvivirga aurantia TaxID=2529383 RepID=UPI0012BBB2A2|nr:DNA mismatch repair endonuclease MutL [Fulvivirga aurantia]MTI22378.1 DNA mismatch repair endonuclease MutL [Fulvivirga aurantia]